MTCPIDEQLPPCLPDRLAWTFHRDKGRRQRVHEESVRFKSTKRPGFSLGGGGQDSGRTETLDSTCRFVRSYGGSFTSVLVWTWFRGGLGGRRLCVRRGFSPSLHQVLTGGAYLCIKLSGTVYDRAVCSGCTHIYVRGLGGHGVGSLCCPPQGGGAGRFIEMAQAGSLR